MQRLKDVDMGTERGHLVVTTAIGSHEEAEKIASAIMEKKLAACVQVIGPIMSMFNWDGELKKEKEWVIQAKTTTKWYSELEETIKGEHPYQLPEIVALPIKEGSIDYLEWVRSEVDS